MKSTIFNGNVYMEYPDDFYEMSTDEIRKYFGGDMLRMGVRNVEKHVILSVGKTKDSFLTLLTDSKSILSGAENAFTKCLKGYEKIEEFEADILGKAGKGIRFAYTAKDKDKDVRQFGEMAVVKSKRCFYVVYCLARFSDVEENKERFAAFRESLQKKN